MTQMLIKSPASGFVIPTVKHYGNHEDNYYQTGGGSFIGDSPEDWNALIKAVAGGSDDYQVMTLVFSIYPLELSDTGNWYIFGSESGNILVGHWDADGGVWIGARDSISAIKTENTVGDGAGDWAGMTPNLWNAMMISFRINGGQREVSWWSNGVEVYSGNWGSGGLANNPMAWSGYCWAGRGDGYSGAPERGMESYVGFVWCDKTYLDPAIYYTDFFDDNFKPKNIGADGSGPTGNQPETYAPDGDMMNNLGTADNWDEVGTVPDAPISPTD